MQEDPDTPPHENPLFTWYRNGTKINMGSSYTLTEVDERHVIIASLVAQVDSKGYRYGAEAYTDVIDVDPEPEIDLSTIIPGTPIFMASAELVEVLPIQELVLSLISLTVTRSIIPQSFWISPSSKP
jgi:hypothetical protein